MSEDWLHRHHRPRRDSVSAVDEVRSDGRRVNGNALPEHAHYEDTGCEVAPACLSCPLPRCKYDEPGPGGFRAALKRLRAAEMERRRRRGETAVTLARTYGMTKRNVFRILQQRRPVTR
jgi:hypothetical protein